MSLKTNLTMVIVLMIIMSAGVQFAYSQVETGQITGTVTDPSGAIIPNAKITAKSTTTGSERQTTSSSSGTYTIPNLQPGRYSVNVEAQGFSAVQHMANVTVGAAVGLDVKMEVGGLTAAVEVTETTAGVVNTETQSLSQTVTGEQVLLLPSLTRNPYDFVQTVGNVSDGDPSGRGAGVAINGLRATSTNIMLDGVPNNNEFSGDIGIEVPLDSVE